MNEAEKFEYNFFSKEKIVFFLKNVDFSETIEKRKELPLSNSQLSFKIPERKFL